MYGAQSSNYPYLFAGMEYDPTGLYHTYARYYHPRLQRFLSEDPLQYGGGDINLFAYVGNDPINGTDRLGLQAVTAGLSVGYCAYGFIGDFGAILSLGIAAGDVAGAIAGAAAAAANAAGSIGISGGSSAAGGGLGASGGGSAVSSVAAAGISSGQIVLAENNTSGSGKALDVAVAAASLGLDAAGMPEIGLALELSHQASKGGVEIPQSTLEHIVEEHWATSGAAGKGKFLGGTTARGLRDMINETVAKGSVRGNTRSRAGNIYEYDFGQPIGFNGAAQLTSRLRVVVVNNTVVTAFPF